MMQKAKELKQVLKQIGATQWGGQKVRVRTQINRIGPRMYEYGHAVAFTDPLTDEQKAVIMKSNPYARIIEAASSNINPANFKIINLTT